MPLPAACAASAFGNWSAYGVARTLSLVPVSLSQSFLMLTQSADWVPASTCQLIVLPAYFLAIETASWDVLVVAAARTEVPATRDLAPSEGPAPTSGATAAAPRASPDFRTKERRSRRLSSESVVPGSGDLS